MSSPAAARRFLRVKDITQQTGLSKSKVFDAIRRGALRARKLEGVVLIDVADFEAWIGTAEPYNEAPPHPGLAG